MGSSLQLNAWLLFISIVLLALQPLCPAEAQDSTNKHAVEQPSESIEEPEEGKRESEGSPTILKFFANKATLSGLVELNYEFVDVSDIDDEDSGSSSDLFLGSVELALRVFFNEWSKAKVVVNAEDVGKGGDGKMSLDEAIVTLECPWAPLYFTGGKTNLPFGVFEDRMISGTLAEDLYEINALGATLGFEPDLLELDISLTVYKGNNVIENLEDFGTHEFRSGRDRENKVDSFIASISLEPVEEKLVFRAFYDNEPGDGRRNQSIGGALTVNFWKFILDAEYIQALEREKGEDGKENKENAWSVALAFQPVKKFEMAARFEVFNDGRSGDQDEVLDHRYLAGFNYALSAFAVFSFEYLHSRYEKEKGSNAADRQNQFQVQLALEF